MLRYTYIQYQRIPSQMAHTILVTKSAEAALKNGLEAWLLLPRRTHPVGFNPGPIHQYYGLDKRLKLKFFWVPEFNLLPNLLFKLFYRFSYLIPVWIFALRSAVWVAKNRIQVVQSCNLEVVLACGFLPQKIRPKIIYEIHAPNDSWLIEWYQKIAKSRIDLWLLSSDGLKSIPKNLKINQKQILVVPNGFEPKDYSANLASKKSKKFTIGYVGRFETMGIEKGIFTLIKAVGLLKQKLDLKLLIVGGPETLANEYRNLVKSLGLETITEIRTAVSPSKVGETIQELDLATMIYPDVPHFRQTMSPMKAIEYMAAGVPVLASDLPASRRILGKSAMYVKADDIKATAAMIEKIISNYDKYKEVAIRSQRAVQELSWQNRQAKIFQTLEGINVS